MTHTYEISGMTCEGCVARVKSELLKLGHVLDAKVQLISPQAIVTMSNHINTGHLQAAVSRAGKFHITEVVDHAMHNVSVSTEEIATKGNSYYPVFLIFAYIVIASLLAQFGSGDLDLEKLVRHFMAGFFLVFSFFKLLNIKGFAEGYSTYDVVAKTLPAWGFIYPFIELGLGILFLTGLFPLGTNIVTFIVMGVSSIGVIQSLIKNSPFQCACLGTIIKLPLSKVTLFEDVLMVVMSGIMIIR